MGAEVWIMAPVTALIGLWIAWASIVNFEPAFKSHKIAFLEKLFGRTIARILVAGLGIALVVLAASMILYPE